MSRLEDAARKIVRPMMAGFTFPLRRADQSLLFRWLVKTAMTVDAARAEGNRFFTQAERIAFWQTGLPARTTGGNAGVGRYSGAAL
jgi:hypothetical protein